MKVKVRKITDGKNLHIQYILPEKDRSIIYEAMKEVKKIREIIKSTCQAD